MPHHPGYESSERGGEDSGEDLTGGGVEEGGYEVVGAEVEDDAEGEGGQGSGKAGRPVGSEINNCGRGDEAEDDEPVGNVGIATESPARVRGV